MTLRARLAVLFAVVAIGGVAAASVAAYITFSNELHQEIDQFLQRRPDENLCPGLPVDVLVRREMVVCGGPRGNRQDVRNSRAFRQVAAGLAC